MVHHWPPSASTVLSLFRSGETTLHSPGAEGNFFFPALRKVRQDFLSQNNLSLCLTRLPAIFTQLKLQMIYFQLHCSPALWHMVLSITLVTTEQERQGSETLSQTERGTEKYGKKGNKRRKTEGLRNLVGTNSYWLRWLVLVVRRRGVTHQSEWNYWAFIKQTAGLLRSLKAATKHSPPTRLPDKILLCFFTRSIRLVCCCKNKTN